MYDDVANSCVARPVQLMCHNSCVTTDVGDVCDEDEKLM